MRHSVHCSFCSYVHYPWFQKKNLFIIFYFVNYAMVMSKRSKISFQRCVHDAMIMKNIRFTLRFIKKYINCYYVDYAAIMTKKYIFLFSALLDSINRDDEKKTLFSLLLIATTFTTLRSSQKNIFPIATMFTTP